jgi:hypothetical protein
MKIGLYCPKGCSQFSAPADTPADEIVDRMIDEGPWYALAAGETFDEMVQAALSERGRILCPDCGKALSIRVRPDEEQHPFQPVGSVPVFLARCTGELTPCS